MITPSNTDRMTWDDALKVARLAIYEAGGRGMIGAGRRHIDERVARAILTAAESGEAAIAKARADAFEEAALWHDGEAARLADATRSSPPNAWDHTSWHEHVRSAAALRSRKLSPGMETTT